MSPWLTRRITLLVLLLTVHWSFAQDSPPNVLRITLVKDAARDEIVIHFRADATAGFDYNADAWKLFNGVFDLSSVLADGSKLAINSLPLFDSLVTVMLAVDHVAPGTYDLEFSDFASFPDSVSIGLFDAFTSTHFDIRSGGSYSFLVTTDSASLGSGRFEVTFSVVRANKDEESTVITQIEGPERTFFRIFPNPVLEELFVEISSEGTSGNEISILNAMGQVIGKIELHQNLTTITGQFNMSNCPPGMYIVRLLDGKRVRDRIVVKN